MISSNDLSTFILHQNLNGLCDKNICLIQYIMRMRKPARENFKHICKYFPDLNILAKSATPGDAQLTLTHTSVGKNPLGGSVTAFALVILIEATTAVSINIDIAFTIAGNKIRIPITKLILRTAVGTVGNLAKSKNRETGWC